MILIVLPDIQQEDQLIHRARRGDKDALREIYTLYFPPIFQYIRLRIDNVQVAEDLTSEVFLNMLTAFRGRNAPRKSLRGWLFRVARNVMSDHYGRVGRFTTTTLGEWLPSGDDVNPEIQLMRNLSRERAREALQQLTYEQQEVIILRFGHALSIQETATIMDRSPSAIKSLQFRAVNSLRRIVKETRIEQADAD